MKKNLFFVGIILAFIFSSCHKPEITCEIVKPTPDATFELGKTIELAVSVNVENTSIDVVHIYLDDIGYDKKFAFPFNFRIHTQGMEKGTHTIRVVAIANSGAKVEKTVSFTLTKYESPDFVSFSDGTFPKGWTSDGWSICTPGYDDNYAIRAYGYYHSVSAVKTCGNNIKYVEFYAREDEPYWYYSELGFYMDGQMIDRIVMTNTWTKYAFPVPAGEHVFTWRVLNGSSDTYVYLDNISFLKEIEEEGEK